VRRFQPRWTRVVTASFDGTARIWDAASGKEIVVLRGHEGTVDSAAFSPDGTRIITASLYDKTVCIWDAHSGKQIGILRSESAVYSAAYSPDMRFIVNGADGTASVWLAAKGDEIAVLRGHRDLVHASPSAPTARG
jgi:WD40 repeat protein